MSDDLVSVIVPVYNSEKYFEQCLDSIVKQSYRNLQIILVDDGSTDSSGETCDRYARSDSRFRVIHKQNAGVAAARNTGLDAADGEFITFVDSDDYIHPQMVSALLEAVQRDGSCFSMCGLEYVFEDDYKPTFMTMTPLKLVGCQPAVEVMRVFCAREPFATASVWLKLYRRRLFDALRFKTGCLFEDTFIMPEIYTRAKTITILAEKYYCYRQRANSITHGEVPSHLYRDLYDARQNKILTPKRLGLDDFSCRIDSRALENVLDTWRYMLDISGEEERKEWEGEWKRRRDWFESQRWEVINGNVFLTLKEEITNE